MPKFKAPKGNESSPIPHRAVPRSKKGHSLSSHSPTGKAKSAKNKQKNNALKGTPKGEFSPLGSKARKKYDSGDAKLEKAMDTKGRHLHTAQNKAGNTLIDRRYGLFGQNHQKAMVRGHDPNAIANEIGKLKQQGKGEQQKPAKNPLAHMPFVGKLHGTTQKLRRRLHQGEGGGILYMFGVSNMMRRLMILVLDIVNLAIHAVGGVMKTLSAIGGFFGGIAGAIGGALGLSAHVVEGIATIAIAAIGICGASTMFISRDMEQVGCQVAKVADSSSFDNVSGAGGPWTKKGSKAYNIAKDAYIVCKKNGMSDAQAAGVVGNPAGAEDTTMALKEQEHDGSGLNGGGLFQFTGGTKTEYLSWCHSHHETPWTVKSEVLGIFGCYGSGTLKKYISMSKGASPAEAAYDFFRTCEMPGGSKGLYAKQEVDGLGNAPNGNAGRSPAAKKLYSMFNGVGGNAADNDAAASGESGSKCGGSSDSGNTGDSNDLIKNGERYLGLKYSEGTHVQGAEDIGKGKSKSQCSPTDCSGFVWGDMKYLHYKVSSSPWTTGPEQSFKGMKHISANSTGAGTVLVENTNGDPHTGFLKEKWRGKATKFLDEDGGTSLGHCVGNNTYGTAFYGCYGKPTFCQPEK